MSCTWHQDEDGTWWTTCGNAFVLNDGKPSENKMKFCPYCGAKLKEVIHYVSGFSVFEEDITGTGPDPT